MATIVYGKASAITFGSDYSYAATQNGPMAIKDQLINLRLDNKPVLFRTRTLPSITEGDLVAVIGKDDNGQIKATALRNVTTGALYHPKGIITAFILSGILILLGIGLLFIFIGLFFIAFGAWVMYKAIRIQKEIGELKAWSPPASA